MKMYVLSHAYAYGDTYVLGVYATKDEAMAAGKLYCEREKPSEYSCVDVVEYVVGAEPTTDVGACWRAD